MCLTPVLQMDLAYIIFTAEHYTLYLILIFSYAQRRKRAVFYLYDNIWLLPRDLSPCSWSVRVTFTFRVTKRHPAF